MSCPAPRRTRPKLPAASSLVNCRQTAVLTTSDRIVVSGRDKLETRTITNLSNTNCQTAFVQVSNGVVGTNVKDRLFVYSDDSQSVPAPALVQVNFPVQQQLACLSNWLTTNTYVAPQNGLYQVQVSVSILGGSSDSRVFLILSRFTGPTGVIAQTAATVAAGLTASLTTQAIVELQAGQNIFVELDNGSSAVTLQDRSIVITQL